MEEDDRHPISGDRIPDEGDLDSDGDDELLDGRSASHKSARSGSASLQSNTMLSNLLDPSSAHEPFDEWESLPPKYLVSDSKTYLAYFKAFVGAGARLALQNSRFSLHADAIPKSFVCCIRRRPAFFLGLELFSLDAYTIPKYFIFLPAQASCFCRPPSRMAA